MAQNQQPRGWRQRWLSFTRRRSPARRISATMLIVVGALIGIIAFFPVALLGHVTQWLGLGVASATHAHVLVLPAAALLLVGLPLLFIPRSWHFANAARPQIAAVSVYMDLENQLGLGVSNPTATTPAPPVVPVPVPLRIATLTRQIQHYIRTVCQQDRADMFFYADSLLYADEPYLGEVFRSLWGQGFRLIDTPHTQLVLENEAGERERAELKDTADLVLALHAYERALLADGPRHIILVTGDKDFVPLIYQLHFMGHHVHLISLRENDKLDLFARKLGITPVFIPNYGDRSLPRQREALVAALAHTIEAVSASWAPQQMDPNVRYQQLGARLAKVKAPSLPDLGYETDLWLDELRATGMLDQLRPAPHVNVGTVPETQGLFLQQFIHFVADDLLNQARASQDATANLEVTCRSLAIPSAGQEPTYIRRLRELLRGDPRRIDHARALARCAKFLGLLDFTEATDTPTLHVQLP